jgi:hypothetical protein
MPTMRRGAGVDADELHDGIGPAQVPIHGFTGAEHPLRDALADDHHRLAVGSIVVGEVAAGDDRHAERREESRRDGAEPRARVLLAWPSRSLPR